MAAVTLIVLGGACSGDDDRESRPSSTLRIAVPFEPPSLDPGLLPDVISANFALNMMDPLVKLNDELEPEPALARSWEIATKERRSPSTCGKTAVGRTGIL